MHPNPSHARRNAFWSAAPLVALVPAPAFAAGNTPSAWSAYLFFAIVATVVIVLLLHEALGDEEGSNGDDDRTRDALGLPRYVAARSQRDTGHDGAKRPRA